MAVISDKASTTDEPTVVSLSDYYPFGMTEPGRSYNSNTSRFGYTGHEKENDLAEGVYTTQYRLLDTRLGRWMSVDPLFAKYPDMSAYNYCGGNPVVFWDPDGGNYIVIGGLVIIGLKLLGKKLQSNENSSDVKTVGFICEHPGVALRTGDCIDGLEKLPWLSMYAGNFQVNLQNAKILKKTTKSNDLEGSEGNAYRHVLWQAMITSEFSEEIATQIGNVHEDDAMVNLDERLFKTVSEADQTIDLLNNEIGRAIGKRNPGCSKNDLAKEVLKEFKNSGFYVAEQCKDGKYFVYKKRISEYKYNEGIKLIDTKGENGLNK